MIGKFKKFQHNTALNLKICDDHNIIMPCSRFGPFFLNLGFRLGVAQSYVQKVAQGVGLIILYFLSSILKGHFDFVLTNRIWLLTRKRL